MTDVYAWWRAALDAPNQIGKSLKMTTTPEPGFYRRRFVKNGPWVPVWIYPQPEDGSPWLARVTDEGKMRELPADDQWMSCRDRPITQAEYERVAEQGLGWSDQDPVVAKQRREAAKPGDNQPADEAEILQSQIESASQGAQRFGKLVKWTKRGKTDVPVVQSFITDDAMLTQAQEVRSRLLELYREGETKFHKEKDPITAEGRRVDERWRFRNDAEQVALIIRESMAVYETKKLEAENAARAAAEAAKLTEMPSFANPEPAPAPAPPPPAARDTTVKGSSGRAATVGVAWDVVAIVDQDKLYQYLREHADLKATLWQLAQRGLDAGRDVPGITRKVRATIK